MPQFKINGELHTFERLQEFRENYHLPPEFSVAFFQPKDYHDLGSITHAGSELQQLSDAVLASIPQQIPAHGWGTFALELQILFRRKLYEINTAIRLRPSEIDYAATGFGEVCQSFIYHQSRRRVLGATPLSFDEIYSEWLNRSLLLSKVYTYNYEGFSWTIQIIKHMFGRIGLQVQNEDGVHYIYDAELACPAEGFVYKLLKDVAQGIEATIENAG
jgi:hypothetical protein